MRKMLGYCNKIGFTVTQEQCSECFQRILTRGNNCEEKEKIRFALTEPKISKEALRILKLLKKEGKKRLDAAKT